MNRPREIFVPWDAEGFGASAHDDWYRDVLRWGPHDHPTATSADNWWIANVGVGEGFYSYGMRHPQSQAEVDEAYRAYWSLFCELTREMREDERPCPEHPGRMATRWENVDD